MTLNDEMERVGNWLFRWRSYLPLVLLAVFLLSIREYQYPGHNERFDEIWEMCCLAVCFAGLGIRIITVGYTPAGTSGRNTKKQVAETLNTTGVYSIVRHPLYLGNFFMWLGIVLFVNIWHLTLIFILIYWLYYERIMFAEESFLKRKFGDQFAEWADRTPAFIPRFRNYIKPAMPFSIRNVLKREYNGFFAIILVLFIFEEAGDWIVNRKFEMDLQWKILLSAGAFIWIVLRTIKKKTRLLHVEGR